MQGIRAFALLVEKNRRTSLSGTSSMSLSSLECKWHISEAHLYEVDWEVRGALATLRGGESTACILEIMGLKDIAPIHACVANVSSRSRILTATTRAPSSTLCVRLCFNTERMRNGKSLSQLSPSCAFFWSHPVYTVTWSATSGEGKRFYRLGRWRPL